MSFSYDRYNGQQRRVGASQRTALNYWLPLGFTVAAATIGFAAWAWKERGQAIDDSSSDDERADDPYASSRKDDRTYGSTSSTRESLTVDQRSSETLEVRRGTQAAEQQETVFGRVSGAIKRTPSPQQFLDGASKRVAAGVAAAGAVVGRGLSSLNESDEDFQDHERWSAEAEKRAAEKREAPARKKRMIAVVVSAAGQLDSSREFDPEYEVEHASILSHLPLHIDSEAVDLLVLIYAPELTSYPLPTQGTSVTGKARAASSTASSFSNISTHDADEDTVIDTPATTPGGYYASLQASALRLVPHPTHIIPFTTPTGHVHLLRHLSPSLVYIQEDLCGADGEDVKQIEGWVGQVVVVVGGEGLAADTETEDEGPRAPKPIAHDWWRDSRRVGLGKAEVVESMRFEEDWMKRVGA